MYFNNNNNKHIVTCKQTHFVLLTNIIHNILTTGIHCTRLNEELRGPQS